MNCPGCGLQTLSDQKFCRSCGAGLQMTTQPLVEHAPVLESRRTPAIIGKDEQRRPNGLVLWGFIMMFIGVAVGVIDKKLIHEDIVTVVAVLVSLAGMFLTVYPFLLPSQPKTHDSIPSKPEVLTQTQAPKSLPQESNTEYVPSITEGTTDLLKSPAATTQSQKHDGEPQS